MESSAATAALEGRHAALRASAADLSSEELLDVIELAQREKNAASARQAVALAHLSARDSHVQEDGTSAEVHHGLGYQRLDAPELAAPRIGCSVHVATNRVLDAIRQLTRTPAMVDAMATGDLDEQRARTVTEETEFLSPESAAEVVDRVKDVWGQLTVGPLRQLLAKMAAQVDPDAVTAHAEDERARRGLTRRMGVHGTDHWRGDFKVEQARGAWAAVSERARQLVREHKADSLELARADAMMELILQHSDVKVVLHATRAADDTTPSDDTTDSPDEEQPVSASATPDTTRPVPAAAARGAAAEDLVEVGGLGGPGTTFVRRDWLDQAGVSDPERDLACDTDTGALVHGDVPAAFARGQARARSAHRARERAKGQANRDAKPRGRARTSDSRSVDSRNIQEIVEEAIDFSESYRVPDPMARLIRLRDGSCRFPGCGTPALQCDLDHVRPWPAGPTSPINLMCLCRRHHRIKQRDGWTVKLHPDGTVAWTDPTGPQRTTWPVDHLHLITAGHTTSGRAKADRTAILSTFEEELIELLGGTAHGQPRTRPHRLRHQRQHHRRPTYSRRSRPQPHLGPLPGRLPATTPGNHPLLTEFRASCRFGCGSLVRGVRSHSRLTPQDHEENPMARFLVLLPAPEAEWAQLPPEEHEKGMRSHKQFHADLAAGGHGIVATSPLEPSAQAISMRPGTEGGPALITEGPFTESVEQIVGFYLLESEDGDDLRRICEEFAARGEHIEFRRMA